MEWKEISKSAVFFLREPFYILSTVLLTLLLPLSFLLLSRLSSASYFLSNAHDSSITDPYPVSYLLSLFVDTNPTLLLTLLSCIGIATLVHSIAGEITLFGESTRSTHRPRRLYTAWVLACTSQLCACLWFGQSLASAYDDSGLGDETGSLTKFVFFLGLHDTMIYWCRVIVKPIVGETVLGFRREEKWVERVAVVASFGGLWWWRLREEVEALVVVVDVKRELLMGVGFADTVSWWVYYLTVAIGMAKIVKACSHCGFCLISRSLRRRHGNGNYMLGFGIWRPCGNEMLNKGGEPGCSLDPTTMVLPVYLVQV